MKKTINYEKDILFKTNIGEICSISLEHDFTVDDGYLRGDFIVSGEYKLNELSVNKEEFSYRLPLEYELESTVDLNTLSYDVDNFEYNVKGDELGVIIDFGVRYEEKNLEPIIPHIDEEELNEEIPLVESFKPFNIPVCEFDREEQPIILDVMSDEETVELPRLSEEEKNIVLDSTMEEDSYVTYHVHIVREGESLETIAAKYGTTVEMIKEYNEFESLELKSKLIIPEISNE